MNERLKYRCQFLFSRTPIRPFADWKNLKMGQYHLYAHPDLEINQLADSKKTIAILGDIYNSEEPQQGNIEILQDIMASADSVEDLVTQVKPYAGCFVIFFMSHNALIALHDARGLREIYYCTEINQMICGSQPHLLAEFSNPEIRPTKDKDLLDFYENYLWDSRWIGDETYYSDIKHLLPNHYLDINNREVRRYWPCTPVPQLCLKDAVEESSAFLQGIIKAIVHRHPVMMGMTSGSDSRTLLAASRGILDKIYFFINDHNLGYGNPDIWVPEKIFKKIGVPFHVHDVSGNVDEQFRQLFFDNTFLAAERLLPSIYDMFIRNHREKVLILGVSEIGRTFYGKAPRKISGYRMASKLEYPECRYAVTQCEQVLPEMRSAAEKFGVNVMALLYWEQRLGNWGAVRNSESLLGIEKVDPFNSHKLYEIFLGVDEKYRNYQQTPCIFFREVIRLMWPELMEWPINPPYTNKDRLIWLLVKLGLYEPLVELKYQASYLRHLCKGWLQKP